MQSTTKNPSQTLPLRLFMKYQNEINKRRTFAIISHPDAGKTTLTEKLLLFGGAIQVAGAVKSNKIKKFATSDFMEIERQRGISVATSVMSFEYNKILINLLDPPGHKDFAEDTYRTLTAVDSVILVIDSVNGVEAQTRRLMEVCRADGIAEGWVGTDNDNIPAQRLYLAAGAREVGRDFVEYEFDLAGSAGSMDRSGR